MKGDPTQTEQLWQRMVQPFFAPERKPGIRDQFEAAAAEFLKAEIDRVQLIRANLSEHRALAFNLITRLPVREMQQLLPELLVFASWPNGYLGLCQDLIRDLPREWVLTNIEEHSKLVLESADEEQYLYLLKVYSSLNEGLAVRLAARAASSEDEEIRFVGNEFLERKGRWSGSP